VAYLAISRVFQSIRSPVLRCAFPHRRKSFLAKSSLRNDPTLGYLDLVHTAKRKQELSSYHVGAGTLSHMPLRFVRADAGTSMALAPLILALLEFIVCGSGEGSHRPGESLPPRSN